MVREPEATLEAETIRESEGTDVPALLIYEQEQPMNDLACALADLGVSTTRVRNCAQAAQFLARADAPQLVFCETVFPDGTWADILKMASQAAVPVNVIIVARFVNIRFYVEVIERGAFDFITPPFVTSDLSHIVRCAVANLIDRRFTRARSA